MAYFWEYSCETCGLLATVRRPMEKRNEAPPCSECGRLMSRVFSVPQILVYANQLELLNRLAAGEETLPGKSREVSMKQANAYAKSIRESKDKPESPGKFTKPDPDD